MVNNEKPESKAEALILQAAKNVFLKKGYDGASMQEIANEAGINKSLLHYYFRSKEKLFGIIFQGIFKEFFPKVYDMMLSENPIYVKIGFFVETYIEMISQNPYIPAFVIHELNRNPKSIISIVEDLDISLVAGIKKLEQQIKKESEAGIILPFDPRHFIVNMVALCVFPVIAKQMLSFMLFENDDLKYEQFIKERKKYIVEFLINSIRNMD